MEQVKTRLYLETTVPSYLTAWPSRDLIRAGHQQITREWWEMRRNRFELYISHSDLELHPHRQRGEGRVNSRGLRPPGLHRAGHLHAGRTYGRIKP